MAGRSNKRSKESSACKESLVTGGGSSSDKKGAGGKGGSGSSLGASSQLAGSNSATAAAAAAANTAYELVQASHALQAVQVRCKVINPPHLKMKTDTGPLYLLILKPPNLTQTILLT